MVAGACMCTMESTHTHALTRFRYVMRVIQLIRSNVLGDSVCAPPCAMCVSIPSLSASGLAILPLVRSKNGHRCHILLPSSIGRICNAIWRRLSAANVKYLMRFSFILYGAICYHSRGGEGECGVV